MRARHRLIVMRLARQPLRPRHRGPIIGSDREVVTFSAKGTRLSTADALGTAPGRYTQMAQFWVVPVTAC